MQLRLTTVGADGRLEFSGWHNVSWMPKHRRCVVEVVARGWVRVTSPQIWGEEMDLAEDAVLQELAEGLPNGEDPQVPKAFLGKITAKRPGKTGRPTYRLMLPDAALWMLFQQGEGPLAPKPKRTSVRVLVKSDDRGIDVFAQEASGILEGSSHTLGRDSTSPPGKTVRDAP